MLYGMPTLVECGDIFETARVAKKYGLDFIEINMSFPQYQRGRLDASSLRALSERCGIGYTIHADEQMNPFDFNPLVSECYFNVMRDTVRTAKEIGAPVINLHLQRGVYVTLPDKVVLLTDVYFDEYMTRVKKFIEMCEDEIGDSDMIIAIENVDTNPFTDSQLKALECFMASPKFALTLDTGHEDCLGYRDTHVFEKYPEKLAHMHLHDSNGRKPHLPLGEGSLDIKGKLDGYHGKRCLIEVKTVDGLEKSVEYLKSNSLM